MLFQKLLKKIAFELDKRHIPYMIIGGQALLVHGEPRLTKDIDITLGLTPEDLEKVLNISSTLSLKILVNNPPEFVQKTWVLPTIDKSGIRVDFIFSLSSYEKEALNRAVRVEIEGYPVKFASAEDLIIHKLVAGRPRDIEDIKLVLLKQRNIDISYIRKWLNLFDEALNKNLLDTFEQVLQEVQHV